MNPTLILIRKEIRDGLRNRWVLAITALLAMLALSLGFLGSAPTGTVKVDPLTVTVVSLSSLSIFLIPLIAMLLSYDAIVGEIDRGTMALLRSYPIARRQGMAGSSATWPSWRWPRWRATASPGWRCNWCMADWTWRPGRPSPC